MRPLLWRPAVFFSAIVACLLAPPPASAQDVTEPSLKAALVFNFARFTEWPDDVLPPESSFEACVFGPSPVGDALSRTAKDHLLAGHRVTVTRIARDGTFRSCHLLYVSSATNEDVARIAAAAKGIPVLTIVDIEGVTVVGGIARVYVENGKLRFDLDQGLAKRSRLQLSSRLLSLASHVHDEPTPVTR